MTALGYAYEWSASVARIAAMDAKNDLTTTCTDASLASIALTMRYPCNTDRRGQWSMTMKIGCRFDLLLK